MVRSIDVGVIGTGWCGGIRAEVCARSPYVGRLHLAEIRPDRLAEVAAATGAATATTDYHDLLDRVDAVMISATPETTHHPMARDCLAAGKHVLLEKPLALTLDEADELIALADRRGLSFAVGYSQRFNPKQAYVRQCVADGTLGAPVSALVSRHITRSLGAKIGGRIRLSPAAMEATHDIDFVMWCLAPARPVNVYAQSVSKVMKDAHDVADCTWITITFDHGVVAVIGAGWILPPGYPNFSTTTIEFVGTDAALLIDDSHRDIVLNRMGEGVVFPLSTMPGEQVGHVYAGPMAAETTHFLESVALSRPVLVPATEAREVMRVYLAADESAETGRPVSLAAVPVWSGAGGGGRVDLAGGRWQPVPDREWQPTIRSLHMWSQIVGKVRLALAEPLPHWWHVPLYVTARGLTTSPMPYRGEAVELEFDLHEHRLTLRTSDDHQGSLALRPMPVADFYREVRELLAAAGVQVRIRPVPVEVAEAVPFEEDTAAGGYEVEHARALHGALLNAQRVLTRFRGGYLGKTSPVHFFWGGFDLAETRFSGRPAPPHPGGIPNCPSYVMAEAYSHEVSSAGWWAGPPEVGAVFYTYMYPEPPAYPTTSIAPAPGFYHTTLREFVLPYNDVAGSADPDATLLAFLEATYAAGATSAGWDRKSLERQQPESTSP